MNEKIAVFLEKIKGLELGLHLEIEEELQKAQKQFNYGFQKRKIIWEQKTFQTQKALRENLYHFFKNSSVIFFLSSPIIYSMIFPLVLIDLFFTVYQAICFPLYGIPKVKRLEYLIIDRYQLAYLNIIEKINCTYCGYGNGLLSYCMEIASRTEEFWCPIKHARKVKDVPPRYHKYANFGDVTKYRQKLRHARMEKKPEA